MMKKKVVEKLKQTEPRPPPLDGKCPKKYHISKHYKSLHGIYANSSQPSDQPQPLPLPKSMAAGRFSSFLRRAAAVPWTAIAGEAFDRAILVGKTVCFVHVLNNYVCSIALVLGPSMLPAINFTGDVVAVERISPRWNMIGVGDIVLLRSPENPMKIVTKRVLGLEGDSVTFLIDPGKGVLSKTVLVPKGHVWVQGDNVYESRDSRQFGAVPYGLIQGRAFCRVWPLESFGSIGQKM